jgi:hypothetical protein
MEPLLDRISTVEDNQSGDVITMGGVSFTGPMDCEVFLKTSVPENIRSAFCYDMRSLTHRTKGDLSTEEILSRDHNAKKGGFPNMGNTFIYTSMQQAVPAPLSKGGGPGPSLISALKAFAVWNKQDGQGGLKNSITKSNTNTGKALLSKIKREPKAFPVAEVVFRRMVQDSNDHWAVFAK